MRIVAGKHRGRVLVAPLDGRVRPTSDRVRQAVFDILGHGLDDFDLAGARVLDLFAGTGALGLEAMSRGAAYCVFVENDVDARGLVRTNVEALGLTGTTRLFRRDATDLGPMGRGERFTLALVDPPYDKGLGEAALRSAATGGWLAPGAVAVAEERAEAPFVVPDAFRLEDARRWGDTTVRFLRHVPAGEAAGP